MPASTASSGTCITRGCRELSRNIPIAAVPWNTAPAPVSPWIMPGKYTVVLTVAGQKFTQPLTVEMDPRVEDARCRLGETVRSLTAGISRPASVCSRRSKRSLPHVRNSRPCATRQAEPMRRRSTKPAKNWSRWKAAQGRRRRGPQPENLTGVRTSLLEMLNTLQEVDAAPTTQAAAAVPKLHASTVSLIGHWHEVESKQLAPLHLRP